MHTNFFAEPQFCIIFINTPPCRPPAYVPRTVWPVPQWREGGVSHTRCTQHIAEGCRLAKDSTYKHLTLQQLFVLKF